MMSSNTNTKSDSSILGKRNITDIVESDESELEILNAPNPKRQRSDQNDDELSSKENDSTFSNNQNHPNIRTDENDADFNHSDITMSNNQNVDDSDHSDHLLSTVEAKQKLIRLLNGIEEPIEVSVGGMAEDIPSIPLLHITDIGLVPLPLSKPMIKVLIQKMESSPFGRHLSTEKDESVRKSYELSADQFECKNSKFNDAVQELAKSASERMGVDHERVVAVPYKLILYEPGSHFVEHRDTEKLEGMFGTLVVQLPSIYTVENELPVLSVKHLDTEFGYHFGAEEKGAEPPSATNTFYAANYCDLRHTVNKIASGHRLILTYNLTVSTGNEPQIPDYRHLHSRIGSIFDQWNDNQSKPLILRLEHLYTERSMNEGGVDLLKGMSCLDLC